VKRDTPLGPGREFDAIRALRAQWGAIAEGLGDDAAVVDVPDDERLVVSTDTSCENVHFRRAWIEPEEIGWRATMAALSDLAAMAARPIGMFVAISVPTGWRRDLQAIGAGIGAAARDAACTIRGGDLTGGSELSLTITVLGGAREPLNRSGAQPGDALWLTGALGGPALALRAWLDGSVPPAAARERFAKPHARLRQAAHLRAAGASAAIDISDGLAADALHLAHASHATLAIELGSIPLCPGARPRDAATSGEEYELLVTGPASINALAFRTAFGLPLTRIGSVERGPPGVRMLLDGAHVDVGGGYDHFLR
jgi:thiamine-monophosphate kinase